MKPDKFIDAMGRIDDKYIDEYLKAKKARRTPTFIKYASLAASIAVILSVSLLIWYHGGGPGLPPIDGTSVIPPVTDNVGNDPHVTHEDFKIVSVSAEKMQGNFISGDTSFVVKTEHGTAEDVRTHLYISTAPEYEVVQIAEETFEVFLEGNIADNTVVSLSYVEDGIVDHSWAFQTEGNLSLVGSYPSDGAKTAPVDTVIELEFSYSSAAGIEEAVTFEPEIEGSWEHAGRIWRFTPAESLEKDSTYKIYVGNVITAEGKELSKTATVTFSTYEDHVPFSCSPGIITVDSINSYLPDSPITVRFTASGTDKFEIGTVAIEQFETYADMIAFSEGEEVYDSDHLKDIGFTINTLGGDRNRSCNMVLDGTLPQGYYAARIYAADGTHLFDWIIQVHPLSVYAAVTERDVLVWVAEGGELAEGVDVVFGDAKTVTDKDGVALLKDSTKEDGENPMLLIGNGEAPFVVGTPNFTHDNYPSGYVYTDRPKYKSTDTIKIWGIAPLDLFYDEPDGQFTVMLSGEKDTEIEVTPDENGVFECEIDIVNHKDSGLGVYLLYEGTSIAYKSVDIYDYYLKNYEIVATADKVYFEEGENVEFEVHVSHVSGIDVAGKKLEASVSGKRMTAVTGTDGIAKFTVTPEDYANSGENYSFTSMPTRQFNIHVKLADAADSDFTSYGHIFLYVLRSPVEMHQTWSKESYALDLKYVSVDKLNGVLDADGKEVTDLMGNTFVCGAPYDTEVTLTLTLTKTERELLNYKYDPFSKTRVPVYTESTDYVSTEIRREIVAKLTENGKIVFDLSEYILPEATDTEKYRWNVGVEFKLPNDYTETRLGYSLSSNDFVSTNTGSTDYGPDNSYNPLGMPYDYFVFGYDLSRSNDHKWLEGETIPVKLTAYDNSEVSGGRLMYFVYAQGVRQISFTDESEFEITVGETTFPKAEIAAAYFKDGVFHRVSDCNVGYNVDQRTLNIGIEQDREKYEPGDKVTLTVTVNKPDGVLEGAAVNISVVNEAVFTESDSTNIVSSLLRGAAIRDYFYSSYRDYSLMNNVGGWGGGGPRTSEFGDTVYFGTAVTDKDGRCTVTFTLPKDRVTSYRVTVHAANRELYAGVNTANVTAASDFFLQPGEVKYTKTTDDLVIPASLITAVPDTAVMNFRINELDLELNVAASTGNMSFANFGKIPVGDYTVTVTAVSETDPALTHRITIPVSVKPSTLEITEKHTVDVTEELEFKPSSSPVTMKFFNEETERYERYMDFIRDTLSERYDTIVANTYASTLRERIYGVAGTNTLSTYYKYAESGRGYNNLTLLEDGDPDAVLTALFMYVTGDRNTLYGHYGRDVSIKPEPEVEVAETLLIRAAKGEAVLADLQSVAKDVSDDPYVHALLSLAFGLSGDTASAKEMLIPIEDNATDGDRALYCTALVFVDREAAAAEIDRLMEESRGETYLGLAASVYMKTGEAQMGDTDSVTVICDGKETEITVSGLTAESLVLTVGKGDTVRFEDATEGMRISYSYQSTFTPKEDEHNVRGLTVTVTEGMSVSDEGVIRIELGDISNDGSAKVALPSCIRYDSPYFGISNNIATGYAKDDDSFIEIPITAVAPGHYILEPVIYTVDGIRYYSDAVEFTVGNGIHDTAVDPVTVTTEAVTEVIETTEVTEESSAAESTAVTD